MIKDVSLASVTICMLVDHPGGRDGGQFPQEHTFGIGENGPFYSTGFPKDQHGFFEEEDPQRYQDYHTRGQALEELKKQLELAHRASAVLEQLVAEFAQEGPLECLWEGEDDEDSDEDSDEEDEDYSDED